MPADRQYSLAPHALFWRRIPDALVDQRFFGTISEQELLLVVYALRRGADRPSGVTMTADELAGMFERSPHRTTIGRWLEHLEHLGWLAYEVGEGRGGGYTITTGPTWQAVVNEKKTAKGSSQKNHDEFRAAVTKAIGRQPETPAEEEKWRRGEVELRRAGVIHTKVSELVSSYRKTFPNMAVTPLGIAGNLSMLRETRRGTPAAPACLGCGINSGQHADHCDYANAGHGDRGHAA